MPIKTERRKGSPEITGIIQPARNEGRDRPARITLRTDDLREYQIDFGGVGKELLQLVDRKVTIQGKLRQQLDGREILQVRRYRVLPSGAEENVSET